MSTDTKRQPVAHVRLGAVSAAIWEQQTADGARMFYNFTIQRSYQDEHGTWHNSETFRPADCMALVTCVEDAFRWIATEGKRRAREQDGPDDATSDVSSTSVVETPGNVPF